MTTLREAAQQALAAMEAADVDPHSSDAVYKAIDALKAALADPVQEPVSVTDLQQALVETNLIDPDAIDDPEGYDYGSTVAQIDALHEMLFKSQRKPLSDEEIGRICAPLGFAQLSPVEVARAIERAHGIGEAK